MSRTVLHREEGLTEMQMAFVNAFVATREVGKSVIAAGYSPASASTQGSQLMSLPKVRNAINKRIAESEEKTGISPESVLRRLDRIANKSMEEVPILDEQGQPTGHTRFLDAPQACKSLELLGKHLRLFVDRVEVDVADELAERIERARQRLALKDVEATVEHVERLTPAESGATPHEAPKD